MNYFNFQRWAKLTLPCLSPVSQAADEKYRIKNGLYGSNMRPAPALYTKLPEKEREHYV